MNTMRNKMKDVLKALKMTIEDNLIRIVPTCILALLIALLYFFGVGVAFVVMVTILICILFGIIIYGICLRCGYFTKDIDSILIHRGINALNDGLIEIRYSTFNDNFNAITQKELNDKFKNFLVDIVNVLKSKR